MTLSCGCSLTRMCADHARELYLRGVLGVVNAVYRARGQVGRTPHEVVADWQAEAAHDHEYALADMPADRGAGGES